MSRPPRPLFPGAFYHVTSRGNRKANIYLDEHDYSTWHALFARTAERFGFICHAYGQMPNHFHLLLQTPRPNLSEGMHFLNCLYSQNFNVRHGLTGHVLQGRFHSVLLDAESHFLELARYIALNPVRAGMVACAADWRWSSYRAIAGLDTPPAWLDTATIRNRFHGEDDAGRIRAYCNFVAAGVGGKDPLKAPALPQAFGKQAKQQAIAEALRAGLHSPAQIAEHFKVSTKTVQRIRAAEAAR
ncbi:transposase [Pseudoduganella violaceinigra]|uniref:transposase n=1 Tax=Pseudoduganella violaceinigra TaxID=246602 RepID=UPI000481A92B|nr:transposase [Pseudoduganella violaceinigra]